MTHHDTEFALRQKSCAQSHNCPLPTFCYFTIRDKINLANVEDPQNATRTGTETELFTPITISQQSQHPQNVNDTWTIRVKLDYFDIHDKSRKQRIIWMPRNTSSMTLVDIPASDDSYIVAMSDILSIVDYDDENWRQIMRALETDSSIFRPEEKLAFVRSNCQVNKCENECVNEFVWDVTSRRVYHCMELIHLLIKEKDRELRPNFDRGLWINKEFNMAVIESEFIKLLHLHDLDLVEAMERFLGVIYVSTLKSAMRPNLETCLIRGLYENRFPNGTADVMKEIKRANSLNRRTLDCIALKFGALDYVDAVEGGRNCTTVWELYHRNYREAESAEEKLRRLEPLFCYQRLENADELVESLFNVWLTLIDELGAKNMTASIREHETTMVHIFYKMNYLTRDKVWEHLRAHASRLKHDLDW